MAKNDDHPIRPQVWDRHELESFVTKLRESSASKPPALDELRRSGKFVESNPTPKWDTKVVPHTPPASDEAAESEDTTIHRPPTDRGALDGGRADFTTERQPAHSESEASTEEGATDTALPRREGLIVRVSQTAVAAFLAPESFRRLATLLRSEGIETLQAPVLSDALELIGRHRPEFVFTGLEFEALHAPSLIAALKACPSHRSIPIAVVTPRDPKLLDLSLYRPDAVVGESSAFATAVQEFLADYRMPNTTETRGVPKDPWIRFVGQILLVESSSMAQRIVGKLLHVAGADVTVVEGASEAMLVTAAREFDLVLLDLELPNESPLELINFHRAVLPEIPIVGLTSEDVDPDEWGVDSLLHKPVRRTHLFALCSRLLRQTGRTEAQRSRRVG